MTMKPLAALLLILFSCQKEVVEPVGPEITAKTKAEETDWTEACLAQDVTTFIDQLVQSKRLPAETFWSRSIGKSAEGRPINLMAISSSKIGTDADILKSPKLRILVNAGTNGDEVDGTEAVQAFLRDVWNGRHDDLLSEATLLIVPLLNPDGNDAVAPTNRLQQNGPDLGVGMHTNSRNIDPDQDFIKLETPESRALVEVFNRFDPHLFIDLHTSGTKEQGYHLTYAPCMSPNVDKDLDRLARAVLLPEIRSQVKEKHDYRTFDTGHFLVPHVAVFGWVAKRHQTRFAANYYGLHNRLAIRADASPYFPFKKRVSVTHAFLLETLRVAIKHSEAIQKTCKQAGQSNLSFGHGSELAEPRDLEVLVGSVEEVPLPEFDSNRLVAQEEFKAVTMAVQARFVAKHHVAFPKAWALPAEARKAVEVLLQHGLQVEELTEAFETDVESFQRVKLEGLYKKSSQTLPIGTIIVRSDQRLSRVAAQLLEGVSEDSLATWKIIDSSKGDYPVLRLLSLPKSGTKKLQRR